MLTNDDEFIPIDLVKVLNIFFTESLEKFQCLLVKSVLSLTRRAKLTVSLQKVQADMELFAGGSKLAGAKLTVTLVVMWTNLKKNRGDQKCNILR